MKKDLTVPIYGTMVIIIFILGLWMGAMRPANSTPQVTAEVKPMVSQTIQTNIIVEMHGNSCSVYKFCIDGVEYMCWERGAMGFAVPHLRQDGTPYPCKN